MSCVDQDTLEIKVPTGKSGPKQAQTHFCDRLGSVFRLPSRSGSNPVESLNAIDELPE
jgi:hypothetical protein